MLDEKQIRALDNDAVRDAAVWYRNELVHLQELRHAEKEAIKYKNILIQELRSEIGKLKKANKVLKREVVEIKKDIPRKTIPRRQISETARRMIQQEKMKERMG